MPRESRSDTSPSASFGDRATGSRPSVSGISRNEGELLDCRLRRKILSSKGTPRGSDTSPICCGLFVEHLARVTQAADMDPRLFEILIPARQALCRFTDFVPLASSNSSRNKPPSIRGCELVDTGPVVLWPIFRLTHTSVSVAAAAAPQWDAAEEHFQIAMQQAE